MTDALGPQWILIGGSGFLGTNLAKALSAEGKRCLIIDRNPPRWSHDERLVSFVQADVRDPSTIRSLIEPGSIVVHMAASTFPGKPNCLLEAEIQDDALPTVQLANICADNGVAAFLFCSSGGAIYGDQDISPIHEGVVPVPKSTHGAMKLATEHYLHIISEMRSLPVAFLRIANPYGPWHGGKRQGIVNVAMMAMLRNEPIDIYGDGLNERDYIYVEDVMRAIIAIGRTFRSGCEAFNIGTGVSRTILDMLEATLIITGIRLDVRMVPDREADVRRNALDCTKIQRHHGWSPSTPLDEGLKRTWDWMRQHQRFLP
jgi:UDP-glucose 4-epimerase